MRKLPPLNALKAFEAAARHLSFTRAADELFVTQAAVSHQVKALEDFLGVKLFIRRNRSLLLTPEGQTYYLELKEIFDHLVQATERLKSASERGSLTISLPPSFAILWFVPRLSRFREACPEIDVRIRAVDEVDGSLTDDVDVAIYYGSGKWPGLKAYKLHNEFLLPVCSPLLLNGSKPLREPKDLLDHTLLHDETRNAWKDWFKLVGIDKNKGDNGPIFSHSNLALKAAVHGQGIALANNVLVKPEIDAGHLIQIFPEALPREKSFYLVCRDSQSEIGKIATFRNWLLQVVEEEEDAYE
ncbi:transcriptional regulator GcvA [Pseudidiomarina terrestris]|uniref:Transcriptional regulator GcvA n=1 Tax=Pseudidiomarina terrestris TaxID=2820060 RepID=A0AAW7QYW2_9GAMM|nr:MULTISPECIES: transcriptional regulator GcvA [unclassified Pseudidiomarina]MDN7123535.1 transcriptional regulator GcvA [Pseudidiomarina sp. 1APP75-32.1]MDN7126675.1 transcriptional regulator GcvA [Pseudidiomarina sp. 1APR75-33.1]MDN7128741.1 transcriptional regulator GcvA [Pseudidiomarina sp. 1APR75-15]MDN7135000.1 transcriptional regulator GcvA [Pseudidiomarina sp. 1ASP75-5]MDN7137671.1 transcriptional regulator GcvA [Pseudidiomarina sp. 1ASP75-14]